ncbi:hypothetical protein SAMN04489740_4168 [Arthrobacter alpinus]|uniref:Uncharacterized protein n=1 Tax=Arthrobacter alpinus TaxID=656366 RepID=A0A1H5PFZ2_9MICC|nr:hypothetical protein [Arthrobacter alpinus]SEF11981.1 hypothetical protein SAMN04489740_4168 [Arthrobacter alpinus]
MPGRTIKASARLRLSDPRIQVGALYQSYTDAIRDVAQSAASERRSFSVAFKDSTQSTRSSLLDMFISVDAEGHDSVVQTSSGSPVGMQLEVVEWVVEIDSGVPRTIRGLEAIVRYAQQVVTDTQHDVCFTIVNVARTPLSLIATPRTDIEAAVAALISRRELPTEVRSIEPVAVLPQVALVVAPLEELAPAITIPKRPTSPPTAVPVPETSLETETELEVAQEEVALPATEPRKGIRRRKIRAGVIAGLVVVGLLCTGGIALSNILNNGQVPGSATTTNSSADIITGWSQPPLWTLPVTSDSLPALSHDGRFVAVHDEAGILTIYSMGTKATKVASGKAQGSPLTVIIDGKAGFISGTEGTLQLWVEGSNELRPTTLPKDQKLVIRSGRPFMSPIDGSASPVAITVANTQAYTPPNPQAVPIALTDTNQMVWAGTNNRLITTAPEGKDPLEVTLETPPKASQLTRIVSVNGTTVLTVWDNNLLALNNLTTGKFTTSSAADPKLTPKAVLTSSATSVLMTFSGHLIDNTKGTITALAENQQPMSIFGPYLLAKEGKESILLQPGKDPITINSGVVPLGTDSQGNLIAVSGGSVHSHARTDTRNPTAAPKN